WKKIYEALEKLRERIRNASKEPTYGLSRKKQMPFFRCFKREIFGEPQPDVEGVAAEPDQATYGGFSEEDQISALVALTKDIYMAVERELKLAGFWESISARKRLEQDVQKILLQPENKMLPGIFVKRKSIISRVMEIAEKNHDTIVFAE
ncbi:MAG: type I restriction enzyme R subunit, partial [Lentimonas sp.]